MAAEEQARFWCSKHTFEDPGCNSDSSAHLAIRSLEQALIYAVLRVCFELRPLFLELLRELLRQSRDQKRTFKIQVCRP